MFTGEVLFIKKKIFPVSQILLFLRQRKIFAFLRIPVSLFTAHHITDNTQKFFLTNEDVYSLARMLPTRQVHTLPHFTY